MARVTESRTIENYQYEVTQLGAVQGRKVLTRLLKVVGPAFAMLKGEGIEGAIGKLVENLTEEDTDYFCEAFGGSSCVNIDGKRPSVSAVFSEHFAGEYMALTKWLVFCFEVNFSSFFRGLSVQKSASTPATGTP